MLSLSGLNRGRPRRMANDRRFGKTDDQSKSEAPDKIFQLRGDFFTERKEVTTQIGERLNFVNGRGERVSWLCW